VIVEGNPRWERATNEEKLGFVRRVVDLWRDRLLLHGWRLHVQLNATSDHGNDAALGSQSVCIAEIRADERYMQAVIDVYPPMWHPSTSDAEREHQIVHELFHAVLDPMKRRFEAARRGEVVTDGEMMAINENVTTKLTAILWAAFDREPPETTEAIGATEKPRRGRRVKVRRKKGRK